MMALLRRYLRAGFGDMLYTIGVSGLFIDDLAIGATRIVPVNHTPAGVPTATAATFAFAELPRVVVPIGVTVRYLAAGTYNGVAYVTDGSHFVLEVSNVSWATNYEAGAGPDIPWSWTRVGVLA
jgi:hypothetical protein